MLDHISIRVKNLEKSKVFYEKLLAALGYIHNIGSQKEKYYGFGIGEDPIFEIVAENKSRPAHKKIHVAFKAKDKTQVKKFYKTALELGAKDNGKPGPRKNYSPTYYAAFIIDMDGNNIEVCTY
jgi:catechol 2,3-dioxygenase-like lactoylglutathione lyase family enzyme